ncbi:MAG: hypothetical protein A3I66_14900 [Burkholderiales bacterium RIFCSPLOWO2_02_FULL_57_36]|nr:MAG: hypothetical protein A3I66_14900 [Burkholderiales bacterium RIFCSPLOWO2_02_FULL_57_36]
MLLFSLFINASIARTFPLGPCPDPLPAGSADCVIFAKDPSGADGGEIQRFRNALREPVDMRLGVALSGGGSKAAPFAMGVLAGLSDSGLLADVDAVSTVSGGTYAAYFYFNRLIARDRMRAREEPVDERYVSGLFYDCTYRHRSLERLSGDPMLNLCMGKGLQDAASPVHNLAQAFVRCRQDVIEPMDCNAKGKKEDFSEYASAISLFAASVISTPFHHVANTLFDWTIDISPTRSSYSIGLGSTYGLIPNTADAIPGENQSDPHLASPTPRPEYFTNAQMVGDAVTSAPYTFGDLQTMYLKARGGARSAEENVPLWIITAHAAKSRSAWGWMSTPEPNYDRDIFEFTPFHAGSGRYGYWNRPLQALDLGKATVASAAFLDANAVKYRGAKKTGLALLAHGFNANWGVDIHNWNTSSGRRAAHSILPFPFYWLDGLHARSEVKDGLREAVSSAYIRLLDGGNSENFGAYSLISRGIKNIIISDAAQDTLGEMQDLCDLRDQLWKRKERTLHVPGLQDFGAHCAEQFESTKQHEQGYGIRNWPYPVLAACVSTNAIDTACADTASIAHRLFIIKPALDMECFYKSQQSPSEAYACQPGDKKRIDLSSPPQITKCAVSKDGDQNYLPCETAGYLVDNWPKTSNGKGFPQNGTVFTTVDSSPELYGAYRELSRHYVRSLGNDAGLLQSKFDQLAEQQRLRPMPLMEYETEPVSWQGDPFNAL